MKSLKLFPTFFASYENQYDYDEIEITAVFQHLTGELSGKWFL
ncbi:MAG: hypothetical protein R3B93_26260 [Bacteroidia bacterium]